MTAQGWAGENGDRSDSALPPHKSQAKDYPPLWRGNKRAWKVLKLAIAVWEKGARVTTHHALVMTYCRFWEGKRASLEGAFMMEQGRAFDIAVKAC